MGFVFGIVKNESIALSRDIVNKARGLNFGMGVFDKFSEKDGEYYFIQKAKQMNGSGSEIYQDDLTGNWIATVGSWFHGSGICSGDEKKLLDLINKNGVQGAVKEIEGFFVILFWNNEKSVLSIVTDIIGSCYCFYRIIGGNVVFSSSSLFLAKFDKVTVDVRSFQEFFNLGIIYGNKTFFNEVKRFDSSSVISIYNGKISSEKYWNIDHVREDSKSLADSVEKFNNCLTDCVGKCLLLSKNPVVDLTSGFDSRVIVTAFINSKNKFSTNVVGSEGSKDVVISNELAKLYDIPHYNIETEDKITFDHLCSLLWLTDGEFDLFEYSKIYATHLKLSRLFDVGFNGSFGELARGYWWELLTPGVGRCQPIDSMMLCKKRFAAQVAPVKLRHLNRDDLYARLATEIEAILKPIFDKRNTFQMDCCYLHMRMRCWQGRIASSTNRIWPCFSPFMFREMIESLLKMDPQVKRNDRLYRNFLARANPSWAQYVTESGCPAEPLTIRNLAKFWPVPFNLIQKAIQKIGVRFDSANKRDRLLKNWKIRQEILQDARFKDFFMLEHMVAGSLLNCSQLEVFMKGCISPEFDHHIFWQRLMTYEIAMRAVDLN